MNEDLNFQHLARSLARQETTLTPTPQISQASHASFLTKSKKDKPNSGRAQFRAKSELDRPGPAPNLFFACEPWVGPYIPIVFRGGGRPCDTWRLWSGPERRLREYFDVQELELARNLVGDFVATISFMAGRLVCGT